jgi:hypothetical protein
MGQSFRSSTWQSTSQFYNFGPLPGNIQKFHKWINLISLKWVHQTFSLLYQYRGSTDLPVVLSLTAICFSLNISWVFSKSSFQHVCDLRWIWITINHSTACTIASSLVHSSTLLNYCNSLLLNLPTSSLKHFQFLNSAACAVTNTSKFFHI